VNLVLSQRRIRGGHSRIDMTLYTVKLLAVGDASAGFDVPFCLVTLPRAALMLVTSVRPVWRRDFAGRVTQARVVGAQLVSITHLDDATSNITHCDRALQIKSVMRFTLQGVDLHASGADGISVA
jgi:hypothetical protein